MVSLRLKNIRYKLLRNGLDGMILTFPANITYLTDYPSRDSCFLICKQGSFYFTDSRYILEAKKALKGIAQLKEIKGSVFKLIADTCRRQGLKNIGFEESHLSFAEFRRLREELKKNIKLTPTRGLIEESRQLKSAAELEKIKNAVRITGQAFEFLEKTITCGMTEIELVAELERFIRYHGASGSAFDVIVASGPNSSFPHHIPSERKIKKNELVLVDMGTEFMGYKSDLTRVFFLDKINSLTRRIYKIVLEAQGRAIKMLRPGVRIADVDAVSRNYIAQKGLGKFFGHSLGHGVGLEVHEAPRISGKEKGRLLAGMVFTLEPAVYLPGKFGIRIEDMLLVTKNKCEVLSGFIHK